MKELEDITIIIPLRVDSEERRTNLDASLAYLCQYTGIKIIVIEADSEPQYNPQVTHSGFSYIFVEDHDPIFYRTRYLNRILRTVSTPVAGVWDSDVIVPMKQVAEAVRHCTGEVTLCYPFDGRFCAVSEHLSLLYKETKNLDILAQNESLHWLMHGRYSVGGAFTVHVNRYMAAGGENEYFYGWGPEDTERRERICNLGLKLTSTTGCLYHLHHPRGMNSNFANRERALANRREYIKICRMNRYELNKYISTWPWVNQKDNKNPSNFYINDN